MFVLIGSTSLFAQNASNVSFKIVGDNAVITYDLDKEADINLFVSTDASFGWNTSFMDWQKYQKTAPALRAVSGDVGKRVKPGKNKTINWKYKEETAPFIERNTDGITGKFSYTTPKDSKAIINSFNFKVEAKPTSVEPDMVWIDGDLLGAYLVGRYPVTVYEFSKFIEDTGYKTQAETQGYAEVWNKSKNDWEEKKGVTWRCDDNGVERNINDYALYPVVNVSWEDAMNYASWLSEKTGKTYHLPMIHEWYDACASLAPGTVPKNGLGILLEPYIQENEGGPAKEIGWFDFNSNNRINPIGQKKPNKMHIYDMRGNMYEWTLNPVDFKNDRPIINPSEIMEAMQNNPSNSFIGLGGSAFEPYDDIPKDLRYWKQDATGLNVGFRIFMQPE